MQGELVGQALPQREDRGRRHRKNTLGDSNLGSTATNPQAEKVPRAEQQEVQQSDEEQGEQQEECHNFEYLDHTADVQLHGWGETIESAFAATALAMMNYQTPINKVRRKITREITAEGHDLHSLLYNFLDEVLYIFHTELLVCRDMEVTSLDQGAWTITAVGRGETFERGRHEQGTEVKAVTYSAMQIYVNDCHKQEGCHIYVIVDI
ncbi:archease-like protein [Dunaliella salina]|uniref:Archease-like protein n=1 Tax=Dunaliella salina TaxID=3046 RepID=A0ABQ7G3J2_DUNSA|nr:archease-like protein [Dunaliella salina]|eukprot:KAF5829177.1 archease-like protein [Dunaliella salina]